MSGKVYWFICCREATVSLPTAAGLQPAFNRATVNAISGLKRSRHGIGDILPRPIGSPVQDHLLCDGSAVSRLAFPQLFAEIGTEWGEGDGSTTFNLPNLIGTLPIADEVPPQVIGKGGTVSDGTPPPPPSGDPGQVGGGGGGVGTGGRPIYDRSAVPGEF